MTHTEPAQGRAALVHFNHSLIDGLVGWRLKAESKWIPNYGDMLVCAALLRQIKSKVHSRVNFGEVSVGKVDYAIVRGSTYLHREFDYGAAIRTIESLDCPVATVGLGAQNPDQDVKFLDNVPLARRFIEVLTEKSKSISVRGAFTAAVVERLGGKSLRITGCPSLFYGGRNIRVSVPDSLAHPSRRLGLSIHSGLSKNIFCRDPDRTLTLHTEAIRYCLEHAAVTDIFEQGSPLEAKIGRIDLPLPERLGAATGFIQRIRGGGKISEEELLPLFRTIFATEEWLSKARDLDAMIGFRFHGNMVALNQGRPCFYFVYDSRIEEFCHLYRLPFNSVEDGLGSPIARMLEHDWTATNEAISTCRSELVSFWLENGIPTSLA